MSLSLLPVDDRVCVSGQLEPGDMKDVAAAGFAAVVLGATYVNALNAYEAATRRNASDEDLRFVRAAVLTEPDRDKVEEGGELDLGTNRRARWRSPGPRNTPGVTSSRGSRWWPWPQVRT